MKIYNPFSLKNKTVLVTGASSGIGRAIAVECSKMEAKVILSARNDARLKETLSLMDNVSLHKIVTADLTSNTDISNLTNMIETKLDGIVHCAGFTIPKLFQFFSDEEVNSIMKVNFNAPVKLTQILLKQKKISKPASIVFISSVSGVYCSSIAGSFYSASKGAINGIVKGLALELAAKGVRVNCVNPGMIETEIFKNSAITEDDLNKDRQKYPLKRYGKPEEVAYSVVYLLSDASAWMTGANILIDGGYTLQ